MIILEIPPNPNCDAVEMRLFQDLEPPKPVSQVRLKRGTEESEWYEVVGWTTDGTVQPAVAQKVEDSGEGVAILVYGGNAGLRLRPVGSAGAWQLRQPQQWGLPFLLTTDSADIR